MYGSLASGVLCRPSQLPVPGARDRACRLNNIPRVGLVTDYHFAFNKQVKDRPQALILLAKYNRLMMPVDGRFLARSVVFLLA